MRYEIILSPEAREDFCRLKANKRAVVKEALEIFLRHEPTKISRTRIKRLREVSQPQYRLRLDEFRVFYDVAEKSVEILAIVPKIEAAAWLERKEIRDEKKSAL